MIGRVRSYLRTRLDARELQRLSAYTYPEDYHKLALTLARQRSKGTRIGRKCRFLGRIDRVNPHLVEIGDLCVIGTETMLLAHGPGFNGTDRLIVEDRVYMGFRALVLPGVRIGADSIVGAGAIVTRDVPPGQVVAGNPARILRPVSDAERADFVHRMENDLFFGRECRLP